MYGVGHNDLAAEPVLGPSPAGFEVVVIAASHGGIRACSAVLCRLPAHFPACIVIAQHLAVGAEEPFRSILRYRCALAIELAIDGAPVKGGTVYVAPAIDQLTFTAARTLAVQAGAPPARCLADPLFASAAAVFRAGAIGVVLTGRLSDGSRGARAVKAHGGRVFVQDPATAAAPGMPTGALATGCCDFVLPPEKIADGLTTLVMAPGAAEVFRVPLPPWAAQPTPA